MHEVLPENTLEMLDWPWSEYEPFFKDLEKRNLSLSNLYEWLGGWSRLREHLDEVFQRLIVATNIDQTDALAKQRYDNYLDGVFPEAQAHEEKLKEKFLASGLKPDNFDIPIRNLRAEVDLFRQENLPLRSDEFKLGTEYDEIIGAQTVLWDGKETTLAQLQPIFQMTDRNMREEAWRLASDRQLADRQAINDLWIRSMAVRGKLAANSGKNDFRGYKWQQLYRFDYTPGDCFQFHNAIEEVVVPEAARLYEKRRQRLGVSQLRPWDLSVDPFGGDLLKPFSKIEDLVSKTSAIFYAVDGQLGDYFEVLRREDLLDLDNRKGKAPGGYCTEFSVLRRPFIFMNAVGIHDDVQTLIHEGGHAFHAFESAHLPYVHQRDVGIEFAEVASTGMELLASPYLTRDYGGFYSAEEAARARIEFLESLILFWPYMAVVDAFQHWAYENHSLGSDPDKCDRKWNDLWERFMIGVDWDGLEQEKISGWQRKIHIHEVPFYYIEYGLAQLGAIQIWKNALNDQRVAVASYRKALSLGGSVSLPELFSQAGAKFSLGLATLREAVDLVVGTIERLEKERHG